MIKTRAGRARADVEDATLARLNAALAICHQPNFFAELYNEAQRQGMAAVARRADMQRSALHAALKSNGNPTFGNLLAILGALGLGLATMLVEPNQCDNRVIRRRPNSKTKK